MFVLLVISLRCKRYLFNRRRVVFFDFAHEALSSFLRALQKFRTGRSAETLLVFVPTPPPTPAYHPSTPSSSGTLAARCVECNHFTQHEYYNDSRRRSLETTAAPQLAALAALAAVLSVVWQTAGRTGALVH